jgi:hypothetical protein
MGAVGVADGVTVGVEDGVAVADGVTVGVGVELDVGTGLEVELGDSSVALATATLRIPARIASTPSRAVKALRKLNIVLPLGIVVCAQILLRACVASGPPVANTIANNFIIHYFLFFASVLALAFY